jgi:DNA polymerase-3 subunit delta'
LKLEPISQVIISNDFLGIVEKLKEIAPKDSRFELFIKDETNFLVSDANEVIAKAYLSSKESVFLCLGANTFSDVVQNRLLKIIEEPPKNKYFILITPLKSALLPTIKSRLPVINLLDNENEIELNLDLYNLNLQSVYDFIQKNRRTNIQDGIKLTEEIIKEAIKSKKYNIDESLLELFSKLRTALDMGSPVDFILTTLLLKLLAKKSK